MREHREVYPLRRGIGSDEFGFIRKAAENIFVEHEVTLKVRYVAEGRVGDGIDCCERFALMEQYDSNGECTQVEIIASGEASEDVLRNCADEMGRRFSKV